MGIVSYKRSNTVPFLPEIQQERRSRDVCECSGEGNVDRPTGSRERCLESQQQFELRASLRRNVFQVAIFRNQQYKLVSLCMLLARPIGLIMFGTESVHSLLGRYL